MDDEQNAFLAAVDGLLRAKVSDTVSDHLTSIDAGLRPFAEVCLSAATVGGKRLRPRFAYWAWRTLMGADAPSGQIVALGAALELLHAAILVHDDVIDASELRRGEPSVRAALAAHHRCSGWSGSAREFGDHTALLIGDLLWGSAHDLFEVAVADLDVPQRRSAVTGFRTMRVEVISGQLLELRAQAAGDFASSTAEKILQYKTSAYTVERPVQLGLDVSTARPATAAVLSRYARATGHAFQLRDDLADLFGTRLSSGKSGGDDVRAGKPTELLGETFRRSDEAGLRALAGIVGRADASDDDIEVIRRIVVESGAVYSITERIAGLVDTARTAVEDLSLSAEVDAPTVRDSLTGLLDECTDLTFLPALP